MPETKRQLWNDRYSGRELIWSAGPNLTFSEQVADLQPGRALDVACGEGRNAIWLAEKGWDVTAIDFSDVGIDKARQIAERRGVSVNWIVGDVSTHALPAAQFDLVAVLYLHTSLKEREMWLANVLASVAPGGRFLYIGHDQSNIEHGVGGPKDPDLLPTLKEFSNALGGFEIEKAEVIERPIINDPGHSHTLTGIALDTLVRARRKQG
ncbi:MAG: class I SAM-dependent methyltransferase [Proteobacteria bacterium]|nr:class I SAM-dependent methyltransferase [Pseudomonadota bacterium]